MRNTNNSKLEKLKQYGELITKQTESKYEDEGKRDKHPEIE